MIQRGVINRAETKNLQEIFLNFATVEKNGEKFITNEDFVREFLGLYDGDDFNKESVELIAGIVDENKDGLISFSEFQKFEGLLCLPDALYRTAFQLFDTDGNGLITFDEFLEVIQKNALHQNYPVNLNSTFIKLYFGKDKERSVSYIEFSQFLHDFHEFFGYEAFQKRDTNGTGIISKEDFIDIMLSVKKHLLTQKVQTEVLNASEFPGGDQTISFPYFMAFNTLLNNMALVTKVYLNITNGNYNTEVTKEEFVQSAQAMSQITPLEVDILFLLCDIIHQTNGKIIYRNLSAIEPEQYFQKVTQRIAEFHAVSKPEDRGVLIQILESVYRFILGAIAGAVGAAAVYPLDLLKTRMQNQRLSSSGEMLYDGYVDCFSKTIRNEGVLGLYSGLLPQLIGVAPEKAIKLVNNFARDNIMDEDGHISLLGETVAGGIAGFSQIIFTNPLEIIKIRLQVGGEVSKGKHVGTLSFIKELGFFGLYKGMTACWLRDIPFNSIYFGVYSHAKAAVADENGYNRPMSLLVAGAIAGVPAAFLVTPADVIKTRIQVVARKGQTSYNGIIDAVKKIYAEEGPKAFWKGALARVLRSSPQFGVTLSTYEMLQRLFYVDFGGNRPSGSELKNASQEQIQKKAHHIGGYQVALPILTGLETKFGISLPRFSYPKPAQ